MSKYSENTSLNMEPCQSLLTVLPFLTKAGMDELLLFNTLAICFELEGLKPLKEWHIARLITTAERERTMATKGNNCFTHCKTFAMQWSCNRNVCDSAECRYCNVHSACSNSAHAYLLGHCEH